MSHSIGIFHQVLLTVTVCTGTLSLGAVFAWSAIVPPQVGKHNDGLEIPTEDEKSWLASFPLLGALIAGAPAGFIIIRWGAKPTITVFATLFFLGWIVISFAQNIWMLYIGRFITGFCGGAFTLIVPVYISETAEPSIKGPCGYGVVLGIVTGILLTVIIGTYVSWFVLSLLWSSVISLLLIASFFMPQSPKFLLQKGNIVGAQKSLQWLRGACSEDKVRKELKEIETIVESEKSKQGSSWKSIFVKSNAKPTLTVLMLFVFQQMGGINAITMNTIDIFIAAGPAIDANVATIIIAVVQVVFVVTSISIVNKVRRKMLLIVCDLIMALGSASLGLYFYLMDKETVTNLSWLPMTGAAVYISAYSAGAGPLPWVFMNDCLPENVRASASAVVTTIYWVLSFVSTKTFSVMKAEFKLSGSFWFYAGVCLLGAIYTFIFVPETKGKSPAEIQKFFGFSNNNAAYEDTSDDQTDTKADQALIEKGKSVEAMRITPDLLITPKSNALLSNSEA